MGKIRNRAERQVLHVFSHINNLGSSLYSIIQEYIDMISKRERTLWGKKGRLAGVRTRVDEWRVECE